MEEPGLINDGTWGPSIISIIPLPCSSPMPSMGHVPCQGPDPSSGGREISLDEVAHRLIEGHFGRPKVYGRGPEIPDEGVDDLGAHSCLCLKGGVGDGLVKGAPEDLICCLPDDPIVLLLSDEG